MPPPKVPLKLATRSAAGRDDGIEFEPTMEKRIEHPIGLRPEACKKASPQHEASTSREVDVQELPEVLYCLCRGWLRGLGFRIEGWLPDRTPMYWVLVKESTLNLP